MQLFYVGYVGLLCRLWYVSLSIDAVPLIKPSGRSSQEITNITSLDLGNNTFEC